MNKEELITFIVEKLKIKPLKVVDNKVTVRKYNTLKRVEKLYNSSRDKINPIYKNNETTHCVGDHYWIDMWTSDEVLVTFQYDK